MKTESAVLRRLGPVPFWRGERKCLDVLGEIYSRAMDSARRAPGASIPVEPKDCGSRSENAGLPRGRSANP